MNFIVRFYFKKGLQNPFLNSGSNSILKMKRNYGLKQFKNPPKFSKIGSESYYIRDIQKNVLSSCWYGKLSNQSLISEPISRLKRGEMKVSNISKTPPKFSKIGSKSYFITDSYNKNLCLCLYGYVVETKF